MPEMPFAPPEGDCHDDTESETNENPEQFRHEQGRDPLVSTSGSSGSSYQAGQMGGYVQRVHVDLAAQRISRLERTSNKGQQQDSRPLDFEPWCISETCYFNLFHIVSIFSHAKVKHDIWTLYSPQVGCR